jgi:hypothetical protein
MCALTTRNTGLVTFSPSTDDKICTTLEEIEETELSLFAFGPYLYKLGQIQL